jgi:hypothetical protein
MITFFVIHILLKLPKALRIDPPIQQEIFRSFGEWISFLISIGNFFSISAKSLSGNPTVNVVPPARTIS